MNKKENVELLKKLGACEDGLKWYMAYAGEDPWRDCPEPKWVLWAVGKGLTGYAPERLDACALAEPWAAPWWAADRLTPKRKKWCEKRRGE